ncbi:MBL fold metallo-hydrolase [Sphingosinicella rhizophila]|uniref:MBL fold metallo-hydrolase n=1 Tax=Sphingosinicella rhizophila TaxID=3050082 RepID=A0ABU3Q4R9_9SPHN|nr:MBL fold metallo-hydrolase [Sphingosinicella sp. GR2756]MDT9598401.1 MBL fold metallo-hydrolase [Sphingosinicella sp. GR2756]
MLVMDDRPPGAAQRLDPLVRRLLADNPSPFTFTGTQTYIVGSGEVAVIDPGPDLPDHVAAILEAISGERVAAIVCTHTHRDHSPASRPLQAATGAPIIGCAALALHDEGPRADDGFDPDYRADKTLADGEALHGAAWTLRAVATPGHTSNHLCFVLEESSALFTGDHVMGWSTTVVAPPDGDMADYMASLDKLMGRDDHVYYPAHGPALTAPKDHLAKLIDHRRQRERQILSRIEAGTGNIPDMVESIYREVDPRLHPAAGRSVLAHLIDLEARQLVRRQGDRWMLAA